MAKSFLSLALLVIAFSAKCQSLQTSSSTEAAQKNAIDLYSKSMGKGLHLYNGTEYAFYRSLQEEYPYLDKKLNTGTIDYDGQLFTNVNLLYDISTDQLIAEFTKGTSAQLIKPLITAFTLGERKFIKLSDSVNRQGFYEILYDGKIKVYSKHEKTLREYIVDRQVNREFNEKTFRLILKDGKLTEINSKKMLLQILTNHEQELKRFIREKKLKFKSTDFDKSLVEVVAYYEQI